MGCVVADLKSRLKISALNDDFKLLEKQADCIAVSRKIVQVSSVWIICVNKEVKGLLLI